MTIFKYTGGVQCNEEKPEFHFLVSKEKICLSVLEVLFHLIPCFQQQTKNCGEISTRSGTIDILLPRNKAQSK